MLFWVTNSVGIISDKIYGNFHEIVGHFLLMFIKTLV